MWRSWKIERLATVAATLFVFAAGGCMVAPSSGIDPSGEHVFSPPPASVEDPLNQRYYDDPMGKLPWDPVVVLVDPAEQVARVGGEVVLRAGVGDADGYLQTNRRLEWSISADSVGQFTAVEKSGLVDLLLGDFTFPRKVTNTFVVGGTGRSNIRLNRGTCTPEDDLWVLRGQGWVSLTSPVEGATHVTVLAPEVYDWNHRCRSAVVHWVDAAWQYPPPSISPAGARQSLATTVLRQTDQSPCEGWRVRYRIVGGPPAGFAPDGVQEVEAPVDSAGRATVEIFQPQPAHGTNQICIEVIRPGDVAGAGGRKLIVDQGSTNQTWSAPDLAVNMAGPASANVGDLLSYRIDVSNPGDLPVGDVTVRYDVPVELTLIESVPPAESSGNQLLWRIGELGARQQSTIEVRLRPQRQGSVTNCCQATAAGGLKATGCATTTVGLSTLSVRMTGPEQAAMGEEVYFEIAVANNSQAPAADLVITDQLDPGLELKDAPGEKVIRKDLGVLAAGQTKRFGITLRAVGPGRLCHAVEVSGPTITAATARACVAVAAAPGKERPTAPTDASPTLKLDVVGPEKAAVGETASFTINLTNTGEASLSGLKIVDSWDHALLPKRATDGSRVEENSLVWEIDQLAAGQSVRITIECECLSASVRACNRATVVLSSGGNVEDESCLEIAPAEAPTTPEVEQPPTELTLALTDLSDPVVAGKELTYEIRATNNGSAPYRQIVVAAIVPEGMAVNPLGTAPPHKFKFEGRTVLFEPIGELAPGETATYRVRVRAPRVGTYSFRVELSAPALSQPLVEEEDTEVFLRQ
ncbi:MAG: DUF11 domain-containing protein [Pirellulales bacterium]|nr:DUF11 domain-containing protein [Pirellulales bacterium]